MNGYHALKGFEYQTTVSLNLLLDYFHNKDNRLLIRPEGEDDLVISFGAYCHYVQIKKPRENAMGELTNRPWSIAEITREILLSSYARIADTQDQQIVVLGDNIDPELALIINKDGLLNLGNSPVYLQILHKIACNIAELPDVSQLKFRQIAETANSVDEAVSMMAERYVDFALAKGNSIERCRLYKFRISEIHKKLPGVLARTRILCTYGIEQDIRERIKDSLTNYYHLPEEVVKNSLVRNLRGFLNDIATQPDKWISHGEFESEIRNIWPRMTFIGEPPPMGTNYLYRTELVRKVINSAISGPTEVIGISGSGKTFFASEITEYLKSEKHRGDTLYAEVRYNANFRDVLAGIAFSLRNLDIKIPFNIAVQSSFSDIRVLKEIARELSVVAKPIFILLDFVEGTCNEEFAKNMREFLEDFRSEFVYLVVFGQESIFRRLSGFQRKALGFPESIDMPGFNFEEFVQLVSCYHEFLDDRTTLWEIFEQLTAGRSSGLYALLASRIVSGTIEDMKRLATLPPEQILEEADRIRYHRITDSLRVTAEKIICFILPFRLKEAKAIFASDYIAETVQEMLQHGLLRHHDEEHLEMHETVRAGLEQLIPPMIRQSIHAALADHYLANGNILVSILHLERAGKKEKARQIAREGFMLGENWSALSAYVANHQLVSGDELAGFFAANPMHDHAYLLPEILGKIGNIETAMTLFLIIKRQSERFIQDFQWAWRITEAILVCDATMIKDLLEFGLQQAKEKQLKVLENIVTGTRWQKVIIDQALVAMFAGQADGIKIRLVPLLLRHKSREALQPALDFLSDYLPAKDGTTYTSSVNEVLSQLKLIQEQDVITFISAIPPLQDIKDIMLSKSVLLSNLGGFIWKQRHILQPVCKKILSTKIKNETILENAMRILVFLGDTDFVTLAENLVEKRGRLGSLSLFLLIQMADSIDLDKYKKNLFDLKLDLEKRFAAFYLLMARNDNVDQWFKELLLHDSANAGMWEHLLLINCVQYPLKSAVPHLENRLLEDSNKTSLATYSTIIMKIGELPGEEITEFLIKLLSNSYPEIRMIACLKLQYRRSRRALPALLELCRQEKNEVVGQQAIVAAIASGPQYLYDFAEIWDRFPQAAIWRSILAGRLKARSETTYLIKIAIDSGEHWQIRRAAILAAGQVGLKPAMEEIAQSVFKEKLAFTLDKNDSLLGHSILSRLALDLARDLRTRYRIKKEWCHVFVADLFDSARNNSTFNYNLPNGTEAAKWFFEKLEINNWPEDLSGADNVNNDLHLPILYAAVLRGLRLCGSLDMIERIIATTDTHWVLNRALCEWLKGRAVGKDEIQRIGRVVKNNPLGNSPSVNNILKNAESAASRQKVALNPLSTEIKHRLITYEDIKQALNDGQLATDLPLIITGLDKEHYLKLVQELSPVNDSQQSWIPAEPQIYFRAKSYSVNGVKAQSIEKHAKIRAILRPLLVVANQFNLQIPWHHRLLKEDKYISRDYAKSILTALGAQKKREKLFEELEEYGDIYLTQLRDFNTFKSVESLFDRRIIPILYRWANAGNEDLLEVLCRIASCVRETCIDQVLATLFYRWCQLIKIRYSNPNSYRQTDDNSTLWRAFHSLKKHPRFADLSDYDLRLAELLILNIPWYHKNDIVEVITNSPRMYSVVETRLMKAASFEHYLRDEVDKLDEAGQRLFKLQ